ncbi:MAG: PQQ-dependent sugar dehydrogenase [Opitutaceae bacterium]
MVTPPRTFVTLLLGGVLPAAAALAADADPHAHARRLIATHCVTCHNQNLVGGPAPNLLDPIARHGGNDEALRRAIREGFPNSGMPGFGDLLGEADTAAVLRFIRYAQREYAAGRITHPEPPAQAPVPTRLHGARLETVVGGLGTPWGFEFLPGGGMLISEREGRLLVVPAAGGAPVPVADTPATQVRQDGGYLDVTLHPRFAANGWIYLAYTEVGRRPGTSNTVVVRGRIAQGRWTDQELLFRGPEVTYVEDTSHSGGRCLWDAGGHLYFPLGDRGAPAAAQDLGSPLGKILRIRDDGGIPADNPFAQRAGAWPSVWSYGHRHVQGLAFHPVTGRLWATEHGPRGGDELNRVDAGANYGWPVTSEGLDRTLRFTAGEPGMRPPLRHWTPSVAPSAIAFGAGAAFPRWRQHLFIGCLGGEQLRRLELDGDFVRDEEIIFQGHGRVRDVLFAPDGTLYLALNQPGRIARLVPDPAVPLVTPESVTSSVTLAPPPAR